jgi:DNA repair protein RadA/Sms
VDEPAMDLPVALAVASSLRERPADDSAVAFGEVGLAGEVRGVARGAARLAEAAAMGFRRAIVPASLVEGGSAGGLELVGVRTVEDAIARAML